MQQAHSYPSLDDNHRYVDGINDISYAVEHILNLAYHSGWGRIYITKVYSFCRKQIYRRRSPPKYIEGPLHIQINTSRFQSNDNLIGSPVT